MSARFQRYAVWFILGSIAVNAVIGVAAIVGGDFSDLDGKILATSLSVTGASVLALGNIAASSRKNLYYVPEFGAAAGVVGFALLVAFIWGDFDAGDVGKSAATGILLGAGAAHLSLLSLGRLAPRYLVVLRAAWALAAVLGAMVIAAIWVDDVMDSDAFVRSLGVAIVLLAALTLAVPVLHRASKSERVSEEQRVEPSGVALRYCPNCGSASVQPGVGSSSRCQSCGAGFNVQFAS